MVQPKRFIFCFNLRVTRDSRSYVWHWLFLHKTLNSSMWQRRIAFKFDASQTSANKCCHSSRLKSVRAFRHDLRLLKSLNPVYQAAEISETKSFRFEFVPLSMNIECNRDLKLNSTYVPCFLWVPIFCWGLTERLLCKQACLDCFRSAKRQQLYELNQISFKRMYWTNTLVK